MPALRERREDVPALARHFMARSAATSGMPPREIGEDALAALQAYDWPGNVRQLRNLVDWLLIMAPGEAREPIRADMLPPEVGSAAPAMLKLDRSSEIMTLPLRDARELFERQYLEAQLLRFGGNISRTANFVGMERSALHRKLKFLGVHAEDRAPGRRPAGRQRRASERRGGGGMSRIAYVNGRWLDQRLASVNIEDRGYQFGDGIYEVVHVFRGRFVDEERHLARLDRSLREIGLPEPMPRAALLQVMRELVRRNRVAEGLLYMQVTRGVARRDHAFPPRPVPPALVMTIKRIPPYPRDVDAWAAAAITRPDLRWARRDIKSINLLPNVPGPAGGARGGRDRGDPLRRGDRRRDRRRRHLVLDRGRARRAPHPPPRPRHPARLHPGSAGRRTGRGRHRPRGRRVHAGGDAPGARSLPHLRDLLREADHPPGRRAGRRGEGRAGDAPPLRPLRAPRAGRPEEARRDDRLRCRRLLPRPAAIVWDWDNTLVDGWAAIAAGLNAAFAAFGLPRWSVEEVRARVRRSLRESFPEVFGAEWERARDIFYAEVRARHLRVLSPMPGAAEALRAGAALGVPMAVNSNKQGPLLRAEAAHLGWAELFRAAGRRRGRGSGQARPGAHAPRARGLRRAARAGGLVRRRHGARHAGRARRRLRRRAGRERGARRRRCERHAGLRLSPTAMRWRRTCSALPKPPFLREAERRGQGSPSRAARIRRRTAPWPPRSPRTCRTCS